jgi:prepilin-type N-terminal cleavage/methylation domain-containing protein
VLYSHKELKRVSRGFTLIEVLVVVLIIGILAAIALPQYQKAVERSKAVKMIQMVKSAAEAQRLYFLYNGSYAKSFDDLDISIPKSSQNPGNVCSFSDAAIIAVEDYHLVINHGTDTFSIEAIIPGGKNKCSGFTYQLLKDSFLEANQMYCFDGWYIANKYCSDIGITGNKQSYRGRFFSKI